MVIEIDSLPLSWQSVGEGEPVLLLHGWGGSVDSFAPVAEYLAAQGKRAIVIDFPGHGQTPPPPEPWSVTQYARLTAKFIERLELAPCDIIAHSFGGRVSLMLGAQYPQLVKRLVLVDAAGLKPKRGLDYYFKVYAYKLGKILKKSPALDKLFGLSERQKKAGSPEYQALDGVMRATYVRVVNQDLTGLLKAIKAPTLLIWGSEDGDTPLWMGRKMERDIQDAGLVVFQGAGHFSYIEQFSRFCAVINSFLGGLT